MAIFGNDANSSGSAHINLIGESYNPEHRECTPHLNSMEVITIDSSDDEDVLTSWAEQGRSSRSAAISSSQAKQPRHFVPIVTPRESQITQSNGNDDCSSSVSSADSIWDKVGLPSRTRRVIEDVLVISDDECSDSSGDCCITTTVASQQPLSSQTQANQSDESTVSSNDSIWFKTGLPSRRDRDRRGDVSPNALESLQFDDTRHDRLKDIRKEDNDNANQTADNILRVDSECSDCSSIIDCCIVAPLDGKQTQDATNYDDSFISSDDSMWDKIGSALKVDDDECSDCSSSRDRAVTASLDEKQTRDAINIDDSSLSSSDSILNKIGLPSRRTPLRIETYYDYFRLKPSGGDINDANQKTSEAINNPVHSEDLLPPEVPLPVDATWRIVLLMDHREFGCANNYLQTVEAKINNHFGGGTFSEITTLPSADYLYVARLISDTTREIMDERVLDMVIERKNVIDVCSCLITDSKKYKPLSFFDAQMYKLQTCGVSKKLFLMEGDEDRTKNFFSGAKSHMEKERRLKRVKTLR